MYKATPTSLTAGTLPVILCMLPGVFWLAWQQVHRSGLTNSVTLPRRSAVYHSHAGRR